jgi:excisionase family DNA binding protein
MSDLDRILGPDLVDALEKLISQRVEAALESHGAVNDGSPWLTLRDCAERLHVSERTVSRLVKRGRIRTCAVGRRVLVHAADLDSAVRRDA